MGRGLDGEQKESLAEETKAILEEARMVLPGIQTLFRFQLVAVFNARFVELSAELETVHLVALTAILVSMSFVMTPAAYHRIAGRGRISKRFVDLASWLVAASMAPLALSVALETFIVVALVTGSSLAGGMIGNEGMVGMPYILGVGVSAVRALVQGGGSAMRMSSARFHAEFKQNLPLQQALYRYTYTLMAQISQTAACNRFHSSEQRLSRWLLMTRDRVGSNEFPLTQEFLAHMLGVRRVGVTEAAGALRPAEID